MLQANFPARRLRRQLRAQGRNMTSDKILDELVAARAERSKKDRSLRGRRNRD